MNKYIKTNKIKEIVNDTKGYYSFLSSLFIIYLTSLIFSYFVYSFISYQFKIFDFVGENIAIENPFLLVFIAIFFMIIFTLFLFFDKKKIFVLFFHLFSFLLISFIFIQANKNKWLEYENTPYIIISVLLLSIYFSWFMSKIKLQNFKIFIEKWAWVLLVIICIVYFVFFTNLSIKRHLNFYSQLYDLGWEHQVLHNLSTTGMPYSTVESKEGIVNWADHTSFIYYLLAPLYKIYQGVEFMLVIQIIAVVLSSVFIFILSNNVIKNKIFALVNSIVFLFHPSVQGVLLEDFHPAVLAFPVFFLLFLYAQQQNFKGIIITTILLCTVREDFIFFAFFIPIFLLLIGKIDLKKFFILILTVIIFAIISYRIMKASGGGISDYDRFYFIESKFTGVLAVIFINPFFIFSKLFDVDKFNFILITSLPFLFLFFLNKRIWILLLPAFLFTIFSKHIPHYLIGYHYSVMLICSAFIGNIYYFDKKEKLQHNLIPFFICVMFFINYFYGNFFSKSLRLVYVDPDIAIEKPDFIYQKWQGYYKSFKKVKDDEIMEFIKDLHKNLKVVADPFICPHLSGRRYIYHIKNYKWADIIIDRKENNAMYEDFELIKETKIWKVYKKNVKREK